MSKIKAICGWALSGVVALAAPVALAWVTPTPATANICTFDPEEDPALIVEECPDSPPPASGHYAAIYYDEATAAYGTSWGWGSEAAANNAALDACRKRGGGDCKWATSGQDVCLALALGSDGAWAPEYGANPEVVMAEAVADCGQLGGVDCKVPDAAHPCSED